MLKCRKTGWAVAWGKRNFILDTAGSVSFYPASPPIFERKREAQMFMEIKIDQYKKTGWISEKEIKKIKLVKVKLSVDLV